MRFTRNRFCKERLTGSRRAYKQSSFRKYSANLRILLGIMQEIDNFLQRLLGLVLAGHIGKCLACLRFRVNFRIGLSKCHCVASAHPFHHCTAHQLAKSNKNNQRKNPGNQKIQKRGCLGRNLRAVFHYAGIRNPLLQIVSRK